jgi:hypothetical protein
MLRYLYRFVVGAHPGSFRRRFGDEMLSIFDQSEGKLSHASLLLDGVVSLLRQWALRPDLEQESARSTVAGEVHFYTFEKDKLRGAALGYGALLSALVLNGVCWTMGYAWNHPTYMALRRPVIVPPAAWSSPTNSAGGAKTAVTPALCTDQGRVILMFNAASVSDAPVAGNAEPKKRVTGGSLESSAVPCADIPHIPIQTAAPVLAPHKAAQKNSR